MAAASFFCCLLSAAFSFIHSPEVYASTSSEETLSEAPTPEATHTSTHTAAAPSALPGRQTIAVSASRPFSGALRRDMAEAGAALAAEIDAAEKAVRLLADNEDIRFIYGPSAPGSGLDMDGFARLAFTFSAPEAHVSGFPPTLSSIATIHLAPSGDIRQKIKEASTQSSRVSLYARAGVEKKHLLAQYDALSLALQRRRSGDGGEELTRLEGILGEVRAINIFTALLEDYSDRWNSPEKSAAGLIGALRLAPSSPLLLTATAELLVQKGKALAALELCDRSLNAAPDWAKTYDVQGAARLLRHLPELAAQSFTRAIALSPNNTDYVMHRASAYLLLGNEPGMCEDFRKACAAGDCEGLEWASASQKCETARAATAAPQESGER